MVPFGPGLTELMKKAVKSRLHSVLVRHFERVQFQSHARLCLRGYRLSIPYSLFF